MGASSIILKAEVSLPAWEALIPSVSRDNTPPPFTLLSADMAPAQKQNPKTAKAAFTDTSAKGRAPEPLQTGAETQTPVNKHRMEKTVPAQSC